MELSVRLEPWLQSFFASHVKIWYTYYNDVSMKRLLFYAGVLVLRKLKPSDYEAFALGDLKVMCTTDEALECIKFFSQWFEVLNASDMVLTWFAKESDVEEFLQDHQSAYVLRLNVANPKTVIVNTHNNDHGFRIEFDVKENVWIAFCDTQEIRYDVHGDVKYANGPVKIVKHENLHELCDTILKGKYTYAVCPCV